MKTEGSVKEGSEDGRSAQPGEGSDDRSGDEEEIKTGEDAGPSKTKGTKKVKGNSKEKFKELRKDMYKVFDGSTLMVLGRSFSPFYTI